MTLEQSQASCQQIDSKKLTAIVHQAVTARGYSFHTGEERLANGTVRLYPAAWLLPPEVRRKTGRREGEVTWRLTLHLMSLPDTQPSSTWQSIEDDALKVATALSDSPEVCSVSAIRCTSSRGSLTVHGETSVTLTCDVTTWYVIN
ncbi:MAG: hypothetical protein LBV38_01970 [Alistipes sp.]|jgi:hypothetical protein|nr:hypothetical protein [Alistipes sp.]